MHPGSGPSDRDNDVLFPPIREHLLGAGIAVCSFDKRGVGGSAGSWLEAGLFAASRRPHRGARRLRVRKPPRPPARTVRPQPGRLGRRRGRLARRSGRVRDHELGARRLACETGALLARQQADRRSGARDARDVRRCRGGDARASRAGRGAAATRRRRRSVPRAPGAGVRVRGRGDLAPLRRDQRLRPGAGPVPDRSAGPCHLRGGRQDHARRGERRRACALRCGPSSSRSRSSPTATTGSSTGTRRASSTATSTGSARSCSEVAAPRPAWNDRRVSFVDWALVVHVLSAFAYVARTRALLGSHRRRAQRGYARGDASHGADRQGRQCRGRHRRGGDDRGRDLPRVRGSTATRSGTAGSSRRSSSGPSPARSGSAPESPTCKG